MGRGVGLVEHTGVRRGNKGIASVVSAFCCHSLLSRTGHAGRAVRLNGIQTGTGRYIPVY